MAGDKVDIFGRSYYNQATTNNSPASTGLSVLNIVSCMLGVPRAGATNTHGVVTPAQVTAQATGIATLLQSGQNAQAGAHGNRPKAFINYILLDEQFKYAGGGASMVADAGTFKQHFSDLQNIAVPKNGYIYVYCSNESSINVFFDNLQVVHTRGAVLEETHYYPFGLTMSGISSKAAGSLINKRGFQGKELQSKEFSDGSGLELYDFGTREQDPQIGRWWTIDRKAEKYFSSSPYNFVDNNPISRIDPTGQDWYYYQGDGEKKKSWHYNEQHGMLKYTGADGKTHSVKGFEYLARFFVGKTEGGEKIGALILFKQNNMVAVGMNSFSGGVGSHQGIEAGNYYMNLKERKVSDPAVLVQTPKDGLEPLASGGLEVFPQNGKMVYDGKLLDSNKPITDAYGNSRIRLEPAADLGNNVESRGLYIHGKHANVGATHGCLCDKGESIQNYFLNQDKDYKGLVPLSVDE